MGSIIEKDISNLFNSDFISIRYSIVFDKADSESADEVMGGEGIKKKEDYKISG